MRIRCGKGTLLREWTYFHIGYNITSMEGPLVDAEIS